MEKEKTHVKEASHTNPIDVIVDGKKTEVKLIENENNLKYPPPIEGSEKK